MCKRLPDLQIFIQKVKIKDNQLTITWLLWDHKRLFIGAQRCYCNILVEQDSFKTKCIQLLPYLCHYGGSIKKSCSKRLRMAMFGDCCSLNKFVAIKISVINVFLVKQTKILIQFSFPNFYTNGDVDMFVSINIWTCQRKYDKWFQVKVWKPMLTNGPTSCLMIT